MNITTLKQYLEDKFHIKFNVDKIGSDSVKISLTNTNNDSFDMVVSIKDDLRLTIVVSPEKYARSFVELINRSSVEKRQLFCNYWDLLDPKHISVKINEIPISKDSFMADISEWQTFSLRYSISPYYEENQNKNICAYEAISNIFAMMLSLIEYTIEGYEEGNVKLVVHKKYERNPINRQLCLINKGYKCSVCGFDFKEHYGEIGNGYIEVHHTIPVSQMGLHYIVDPIKELYPVCSNCHSMLHRKDPAYTIDELKSIMEKQKNEINRD